MSPPKNNEESSYHSPIKRFTHGISRDMFRLEIVNLPVSYDFTFIHPCEDWKQVTIFQDYRVNPYEDELFKKMLNDLQDEGYVLNRTSRNELISLGYNGDELSNDFPFLRHLTFGEPATTSETRRTLNLVPRTIRHVFTMYDPLNPRQEVMLSNSDDNSNPNINHDINLKTNMKKYMEKGYMLTRPSLELLQSLGFEFENPYLENVFEIYMSRFLKIGFVLEDYSRDHLQRLGLVQSL